ncbi:MAG TPA: hypothetical protein VMQ67_12985, partial [Candidatus Saccharimonadales bacterium]|nr:hypothetical protein [Candidatus Saccharimonadales bacterium]
GGNYYGSVGWWIDAVSINDGGRYICCDGAWHPAIFSPEFGAAGFVFSLETASNQIYDVQYKNALGNDGWATVETIVGDGEIHFITNDVSSSQGYYRVRAR